MDIGLRLKFFGKGGRAIMASGRVHRWIIWLVGAEHRQRLTKPFRDVGQMLALLLDDDFPRTVSHRHKDIEQGVAGQPA